MFTKLRNVFSTKPNEDLNIYKIFKPFYFTLTLVGLFPYQVKYNENKNKFNIVHNSIYVNSLCAISSMLVMYGFYVAHVLNLISKSESSSLSDAFLTQFNYILELSTLIVFCSMAYISAFSKRYKYIKILNDISSVWAESTNINRNKILGRLRFQINVIVMGSLLIVLILQLCVNSTRDDSIWKITLVTFSFIYPQMIQMISLAFHYVLIMMVVSVLCDINQQITRMTKQGKAFEEFYLQVETRTPPFTFLRNVEAAYSKAFEMKQDLNEAFQGPVLLSTIQCFHSIVSESYIIYHGLVDNSHTMHNIVNCSIWILYQLLKVYSLAYSGSLLNDEALKIGQVLHCIPMEKQDTRTLLEIQHFSSMMTCQSFLITLYGFFPLNATLMSRMIATVTMYLIILVQFDKSNRD